MTRIPVKERPRGLSRIPFRTSSQGARSCMRSYALTFRQEMARDDLAALFSLCHAIAWRNVSQGTPVAVALVQAALTTIKVLKRYPCI
jgi:hypothetical protein